MDGAYKGKPYFSMDDLGVLPYFTLLKWMIWGVKSPYFWFNHPSISDIFLVIPGSRDIHSFSQQDGMTVTSQRPSHRIRPPHPNHDTTRLHSILGGGGGTWRIISGIVSIVRITPVYKPFSWPFGRGPTTRSLGDLLTMVINHLLSGMILQVWSK